MPVVPQLPNRPNPTALPPMGPRYPSPESFANEDAKKLYDWAIGREMARDVKTPEEAAYIQEVKKTLGMPTFSYKPDLTKFKQSVLPLPSGTSPGQKIAEGPLPDWVVPPGPSDIVGQAYTEITNPVTGEKFMAPNTGYTIRPDILEQAKQGQPGDPEQPADPSSPYYTPSGDELVETQYTDFLYPSLAPGTQYEAEEYTVQPSELYEEVTDLDTLTANVSVADSAGLDVTTPTRLEAPKYQAFVQEGTPEFEAAKGTPSAESLIGDIQGTVSEASIAQAQTGELDPRATTQYQIGKLFESFEEGKPPPAWAAPAVRKVGAMMSARGLGRSSMAAAAVTQAMMESGIAIASQDANRYATIQITNLNNRQQAALQNAMTYAAMDRANLDARMKAAINNSQAFLAMDMENVKNHQQLKTIDLQNQYQKLFNDQAQENAARQFNAKSQAQTDQFFAELDVQVQNANASRLAAMRQFNTDQANASDRYFAKINDARERFNVQNDAIIQQSNANWRREINTANTTAQNEANRINTANLLQIQNNALNRIWQRYRDEASWAVQANENAASRAHAIAVLAQQQSFNTEQYELDRENSFWTLLGTTTMNGIFGIIGKK